MQLFIYLQVLDFVSTAVGLRLGANEASPFVSLLMRAGPLTGVLVSKLLALLLAAGCLYFQKRHVLRWATYWYAGLVMWNLIIILQAVGRARG